MKIILFVVLCCFSVSALADKDSKIPRKIRKSVPDLTDYLTKNRTSNKEKVEAIYEWITNNIEYNYERLWSSDYLTGVDPEKVLKSKRAICNDYVELMKVMLDHIEIENQTVEGYVRDEYWAREN